MAAKQMPRGTTGSHKKAVQAGVDTLSIRMMIVVKDFKNFLEER